uniref:Uncharacterized protein n=1 Tax=Ditylenchus dipsaci TaxID=166011 RepID=A0A915DGI7_9BILA
MEKKIEPNFAHFGIEGSNAGKCFLYLFRTSKLLSIYEDSDHRQITSMGIWPFEEVRSESGASDHNLMVWIHFRGSAIEVFECRGDKRYEEGILLLPDYENNYNMLRVRYRNGGEKCYSLSEDFLVKSFVNRQAVTEASLLDSKTIEDHPDRILMAFEDSTVCIFDLRTKEVIDCLKHPKYHQFLCLAVKKKSGDLLISVSVMGQVYLLKYVYSTQALHSCCVIKRSKNMNCSTMAFSHQVALLKAG